MKTIQDLELILKNTIKDTKWENLVFAAGGYVRDQIMGKNPKDLDIIIDADNGGMEFAEWIVNDIKLAQNLCVFPRFGTAKFTIEGFDIESVMPRGEYYTEGSRKPDVYHTSLKEDAFRRDLTINSLFKNISTGEILDFTGRGLSDIKNKIIETPLNPDIIFIDDPLRLLRCVRFASQLNFTFSDNVIDGLFKYSDKIVNISKERIRDELNKILLTDNIKNAFTILLDTGLLHFIMPELANCAGVEQNHAHKFDVFFHILEVVRNTKPVLNQRLIALLHDIGKPVVKTIDERGIHFYSHEDTSADLAKFLLTDLKYPNEIIDSVVLGIKSHMRVKRGGNEGELLTDKALRKFKFEMGKDLEDILDVIHADNISHADSHCMPLQVLCIRERIKNLNIITEKIKLPITGDDLIEVFNLKPGIIFKQLLKEVEDKYFENPNLTKEEALDIVRKVLFKE